MNEFEARQIAEKFVSGLDKRGHSIGFAEARRRVRYPDQWSVVFDVFSSNGNLIDGPIVVIVEETTGNARLLGGP